MQQYFCNNVATLGISLENPAKISSQYVLTNHVTFSIHNVGFPRDLVIIYLPEGVVTCLPLGAEGLLDCLAVLSKIHAAALRNAST